MGTDQIDILWVLVCAILVFAMQAGFLFLEAGLARTKNYINIALKNATDIGAAVLLYWLFGYGIMFGQGSESWPGFLTWPAQLAAAPPSEIVFFLFQAAFAGTTVTIVSGAVAERMRFGAYLVVVVALGVAYPVVGRWIWGGGWLAERGMVDFAGSAVVHAAGGAAALASVLVIGPRLGVFGPGGTHSPTAPSSMPLALFGGLVLWMGWFGFNGGSTLAFNDSVARVVLVTMLGAGAGVVAGVGLSMATKGYVTPTAPLNGALGGLVAVTAGAHALSAPAAVAVGAVGAVVALGAEALLPRFGIDDVVGAIPVHLGAGAWGTIAVGLFGDPAILGTGLGRAAQVGAQTLGVVTVAVFAFVVVYVTLRAVDAVVGVRVSAADEELGLNEAEHRVAGEIGDVVAEIQTRIGTEITARTSQLAQLMRHTMSVSAAEANRFLDESESVATDLNQMLDEIASTLDAVRRADDTSSRSAALARQDGAQLEERVRALAERTAEIEQIVDIIADLANNSTMLALNATIEAARAGPAGRSFAVVAGEVKSLSRDTLVALERIRGIVHATRDESTQVAESASAVLGKLADLAVMTADTVGEATSLTEVHGERTRHLHQSFGAMATKARAMQELLDTGAAEAGRLDLLAPR